MPRLRRVGLGCPPAGHDSSLRRLGRLGFNTLVASLCGEVEERSLHVFHTFYPVLK